MIIDRSLNLEHVGTVSSVTVINYTVEFCFHLVVPINTRLFLLFLV